MAMRGELLQVFPGSHRSPRGQCWEYKSGKGFSGMLELWFVLIGLHDLLVVFQTGCGTDCDCILSLAW